MIRRRRKRQSKTLGGVDADYEHLFLSAWGLQPAQWRPVGSMALVRQRAALVWRLDAVDASDVALRARRAYDRLGELGVTVAADTTARGIEVTLPLGRVALALRILAERSILPDAVLVTDPPADKLRTLRREIAAYRRSVDLVIGEAVDSDPLSALRARVRAAL